MENSPQIVEAAAQTLAAVSGHANNKNISQLLRPLLTEVWDFLRRPEGGVPTHKGINVVVYYEGGMFLTEAGAPIEAGVLVTAPFPSEGRVISSATPAGRAATLTHIGPYGKLGDTHTALHHWCQQNGHELSGTRWEVYGHWTNDEDTLQTDVFYLLK